MHPAPRARARSCICNNTETYLVDRLRTPIAPCKFPGYRMVALLLPRPSVEATAEPACWSRMRAAASVATSTEVAAKLAALSVGGMQ
jgi:hypothetical protein